MAPLMLMAKSPIGTCIYGIRSTGLIVFHRSANFVQCWDSIDRLILCCFRVSIDLRLFDVTELPLIWSCLLLLSFHWSARVCCHRTSIDLLLGYDFRPSLWAFNRSTCVLCLLISWVSIDRVIGLWVRLIFCSL